MKAILGTAAVILIGCSGACLSASFDCTTPHTAMERMVCADPDLSNMDSEMVKSYRSAKIGSPQVVRDQKLWLASAIKCEDAACLKNEYQARLDQLRTIDGQKQSNAETQPQPSADEATATARISHQKGTLGQAKSESTHSPIYRFIFENGNLGYVVVLVALGIIFIAVTALFRVFARFLHRLLGGGWFATRLLGDWSSSREETLARQAASRPAGSTFGEKIAKYQPRSSYRIEGLRSDAVQWHSRDSSFTLESAISKANSLKQQEAKVAFRVIEVKGGTDSGTVYTC